MCDFIADTFASKVAACQDKYADASVGNVTGSNAVNVFLGIGVAWSIAAIYHALHGDKFRVKPGKSVSIYPYFFAIPFTTSYGLRFLFFFFPGELGIQMKRIIICLESESVRESFRKFALENYAVESL